LHLKKKYYILILVLIGTYTLMEQQQQKKPALFKERASAGDRTYFFDVRESVKGTKYLTINESRKKGDKFEYSSILIFENQIQVFTDGFKKAFEFLQGAQST